MFAGLSGGVLMTSDKLDEVSPDRAELFASFLREIELRCEFPELGSSQAVIVQRATRRDGTSILNLFNVSDHTGRVERRDEMIEVPPHGSRLIEP